MCKKTEADFPLNFAQVMSLIRLAHSYHSQANASRQAKAHLGGCVMLGATVEAMLIVVINLFCDEARPFAKAKNMKMAELLRWDLGQLLDIAKEAGLLPHLLTLSDKMDRRSVREPVPTDSIRQIRNLVHPGRYLRKRGSAEITGEELDLLYATCHAAYSYLSDRIRDKFPRLEAFKTLG